MIKKSIVIILALILLVTLIGCSSKQKEIDALKARVEELEKELEVKVPQYKFEGPYKYDAFITIIPPYTQEGLIKIIESESEDEVFVECYFFLANSPRINYNTLTDEKEMFPDKEYCIAAYKENMGGWERIE